ncbi:MAG: DHH family phosphoesterase [Candidatus Pacebacteria bacterium]|nr:DHH family phosphoesterase [Candidatus Paceibacterota bacterium]
MEILNLKETAQRITLAIENKERIILFADADLDGVCSLVILQEAIQGLGGRVETVYFPNREEEGYGLNFKALDSLKQKSPALLVALDCGIGNFEEIKKAKALGFQVIVIDHHQVLERVPEDAFLVVDPKQEGDQYPFKKLANTGIVYHLAHLVLGASWSKMLEQNFVELTAIATLADMMEEKEDNKIIMEKGLGSLLKTQRPGLKALVDILGRGESSARQVAQKIVSVLNITDIKNHLTESYLLFTLSVDGEARVLAEKLYQQSQQRYLEINDMVAEVEQMIQDEPQDYERFIFVGKEEWPQVLTGAVASRICNKHQKPTFVFKAGQVKTRGSVRTPKGVDCVEALKQCHDYLEMYGGHAQAAGFSLKGQDVMNFKGCLIQFFNQ